MHIPDAFIPIDQAAVYWLIAIVFIILSLRWARREMSEDKVPLIAVLAAGIFAIQALNIPILWGTSGHMAGAALAAIVLGSPFAGVFILTLVLIVQGIFFGDGGITVMGANILNMGIVGAFVGFYTYQGLRRITGNPYVGAFVAGWAALFLGAIFASVELAIAGTFPLDLGLASMGLYHAVIGVVEGGITVAALYLIAAARPDILQESERAGVSA
ncbi:MAG TPA: cobalt transporter CbiM [Methanomicrobiales archaeon]|nr:cobalt transporter CbiM [Methanomicrobiales archaeon]